MGRALELISGRVTAPGATFTAATMAAGNSLQIRSAPLESDIRLISVWADNQVAGALRLRSPRMHDNVRGLQYDVSIGEVAPLMPLGAYQRLFTQDTLIAEMTGSAAAGDLENFAALIYYANLPGADARLATWEEVQRRMSHVVTVDLSITTGAGGGYTGEEAINAESDLLHANTDYAWLGYTVDTECCAIRMRGIDFGNLGIGGPGHDGLRHLTSNWWVRLSQALGIGLIPVFNSANRAGLLVDAVQDENAAAVGLTIMLAELTGGPGAPAAGR